MALFLPGLNLDLSGPFSGSAQGENIPDQDADHILREVSHPEYNSVPATSGWHYSDAFAPATWGVHDAVLPDEELVHNLEHGGIGIHYDCPEGCDELVENLTGVVTRAREQGLKVIMSPYPGMDTTIALAAWTFLDKFDEFDEGRIKDFINDRESDRAAPEPFAR